MLINVVIRWAGGSHGKCGAAGPTTTAQLTHGVSVWRSSAMTAEDQSHVSCVTHSGRFKPLSRTRVSPGQDGREDGGKCRVKCLGTTGQEREVGTVLSPEPDSFLSR